MRRAVETASPIAADHGIDARVRPALTDIDFGAWTGKTLEELAQDSAWQRFNRDRARACAPGGESLAGVQQRVVEELLALARCHPGETVAIVTHAEPIRCVLAAFTGHSLDDVVAIEIDPGRVSPIGVANGVGRVLDVNVSPHEMAV